MKLISEAVQQLNLAKLGDISYPMSKTGERVFSALHGWYKRAAEALHHKRPETPHRTDFANIVGNMQ
jgi:hypothetical protein